MNQPAKILEPNIATAGAYESRKSMEEQWILSHIPLVKHLVNKVVGNMGRSADREDLISAGTLGLVKAAQSFDPSREVAFKTYAYIRVRGSIIDELRGRSFVPSGVHHQIQTIQETYRNIVTSDGTPPSDEELAVAVGLPLEKMYKILEEARRQNFISIHGLGDDQPMVWNLVPQARGLAPDKEAERNEMLAVLSQAITELPQRDRYILVLYYERDLTMKEIAEVLSVTESRVSQLHASALFKLSMKL
ncbi:MAG: FliA/WhiG family RNA polymerase sigma factor [Phycisphaerae bacterium]|nr:FliA/WhiG family RNA polymerase sigma factor [Phycisphaerae bacterium]